MSFLAIIVVSLASILTIFRTLVLGRCSARFLQHDVWIYDTGVRYAWAGVSIVLLLFLRIQDHVQWQEWFFLAGLLAGGFAMLQWIPLWLQKRP